MKTSPNLFHNLKLMFNGDARYQSDSRYQLNVIAMVMYIALPTVLVFSFVNYAYARFTLAAVELFKQKSNDIHMVIMDVVMPKLSGPVAASRMQKVRENFPILFVTGYDRDGSLAGDVPVDREHVLEKPFTAGQLSRRIRRSLDTLKQTSTMS